MNKKIPINPKPIIRETTCLWEYLDEETNELKKEKVTILYRGRTVAQMRAFQSQIAQKGDDEMVYLSEILMQRLAGLPDILGSDEVTLEFLENQEIKNLTAINEAIAEAENPKK